MESTGIVPTMPIGGGDGMFGESGIWLFAILALLWGGNGFGGRGNSATQDDLNFSRMESQVRANADLTERKTDAISNGICTLGYEMAGKFAETNALVIAESQKTRDLLQANKIEALQAEVADLKLQQQMAGVVRYPNGYTYCAGASPFCNGNNSSY